MDITITRRWFTDKSTIGELNIPDVVFGTWAQAGYDCYTLEDAVRPIKIYGLSAIPAGRYLIGIKYSQKMKRYRILLENVPFFTGIYQHRGNSPKDTEGCILVGDEKGEDYIFNSCKADVAVWERVINYILHNPHDPIYFNIVDSR
ncbi:MAG TPA: DUF5675 family protein [Candidatus Goldiibacteriota bacterium]|nr:DUF5675 family protein [Candidatus Goldiibacteriota bacterium]